MNDQLNQVLSALWVDDLTVHRVTAGEITPATAPLFDNFLSYATREMKERSLLAGSMEGTPEQIEAKIEHDLDLLLQNLRATALVWVTPKKMPGSTGWLIGTNYVINSPEGLVDWQKRSVIIPLNFMEGNAGLKGGFSDPPNIRISLKDPKLIGCKQYFGDALADEHFCSLIIPLVEYENRLKLLKPFNEIVDLGRNSKFELFDSFNQPRVLTRKWGTK